MKGGWANTNSPNVTLSCCPGLWLTPPASPTHTSSAAHRSLPQGACSSAMPTLGWAGATPALLEMGLSPYRTDLDLLARLKPDVILTQMQARNAGQRERVHGLQQEAPLEGPCVGSMFLRHEALCNEVYRMFLATALQWLQLALSCMRPAAFSRQPLHRTRLPALHVTSLPQHAFPNAGAAPHNPTGPGPRAKPRPLPGGAGGAAGVPAGGGAAGRAGAAGGVEGHARRGGGAAAGEQGRRHDKG